MPAIQLAINTTVASSHGYTPFHLEFGTGAPSKIGLKEGDRKEDSVDEERFYKEVSQFLESKYGRVRENFQNYQEKMRDAYGRIRREKPP